MTSNGSSTLPSDLDILCSSPLASFISRKPWMNRCSGSGMSAASSIAGQKTAWNLRMSLPMTWKSAGQNVLVSSLPSWAKESAV